MVGIAQRGSLAGASIWMLHDGRVVTEQFYILEDRVGRPRADLLRDLLLRHYSLTERRPQRILVPQEPSDHELLEKVIGTEIAIPDTPPLERVLERTLENTKIALDAYLEKKFGKLAPEVRKALVDVARKLSLGYLPRRIEGYDISTTQGTEPVGAQVTFLSGKPAKDEYRRYHIKELLPEWGDRYRPNDYAMMAEILRRRFRRIHEGDPEPDLILIDGGKGHLRVALRVMQEFRLFVPVVALAKGEEKLFVPEAEEPLRLPRHSPALRLLIAVRDEAHRFANTYHQERRRKRLLSR